MKFCTKCGAELPEDAKFCRKCGREQEKREKRESRTKEKLKGKSKKDTKIAIGIVLIIILCVFAGVKIIQNTGINRPFTQLCTGMSKNDYSKIEDAFLGDLYEYGPVSEILWGEFDDYDISVRYSFDIVSKEKRDFDNGYDVTVKITAKKDGEEEKSKTLHNVPLYKSDGRWYITDSNIIFEMVDMR